MSLKLEFLRVYYNNFLVRKKRKVLKEYYIAIIKLRIYTSIVNILKTKNRYMHYIINYV